MKQKIKRINRNLLRNYAGIQIVISIYSSKSVRNVHPKGGTGGKKTHEHNII